MWNTVHVYVLKMHWGQYLLAIITVYIVHVAEKIYNPNSLSIVTEQKKSFKIQQLLLLSRELGLISLKNFTQISTKGKTWQPLLKCHWYL